MPLHLDYRPRDFEEFVGNDNTIDKLVSILDREDKPHAFLLQGPSGCGKTTLARIIKNELKCHDQDFIEINAANSRGIDTARELIQTSIYKPIAGPTRIILLDEVHMGTRDFQTALLKVLEDTPESIYFILCTTEPEKLLKTVKNRCSILQVRLLNEDEISDLIDWVLEEEQAEKNISKEAKDALINSCEGCPRQALVLLDQIIDLPIEKQETAIKEFSKETQTIELCRALLNRDAWAEIKEILKGLKNEDPEKVRRAILGYMMAVILNETGMKASIAAFIINMFKDPTYNGGWPLICLWCFECLDDEAKDVPF